MRKVRGYSGPGHFKKSLNVPEEAQIEDKYSLLMLK